jgi:hypothetical protein
LGGRFTHEKMRPKPPRFLYYSAGQEISGKHHASLPANQMAGKSARQLIEQSQNSYTASDGLFVYATQVMSDE